MFNAKLHTTNFNLFITAVISLPQLAVFQSAPYTPPSLCDTIYVPELHFETNLQWFSILHRFGPILQSDRSKLIKKLVLIFAAN
jgi:hypothetical protein